MTKKLPLHADTVGSYLRSDAWKQAHADYKVGKISLEVRDAIVEQEVRKLVDAQLEAGIQVVTDGEYHRSWWHIDFLENLNGIEGYVPVLRAKKTAKKSH